MEEPKRMGDGNWIMAGLQVIDGIGKANNPAAVAISHGDNLLARDLLTIPRANDVALWGESAVVVHGHRVTCISRYGRPIERDEKLDIACSNNEGRGANRNSAELAISGLVSPTQH
ncbi:MAG: hypothetical protein KDA91_12740 [Planctomycetaceae bacterium]|nr:hypothetical protein [Planctomycetaceae bacterium]